MAVDPGACANLVGLVANVLLAVAKFVVGVAAGSSALVADGFNSIGDVLATGVAYAGYTVGRLPPDENHHYGHGNAESVAGFVIGVVLMATGVFIAVDGLVVLGRGVTQAPELLAVWVAVGTAVVKEGLYRYASTIGRAIRSPSLLASARDHRADVFVAIGVVIGVLAARTGVPWLDPLAAVLIGLYIAFMAIEPIRENFGVLMDEAPPELGAAIQDIAQRTPDVRSVDRVRVHPLGAYFVVGISISVDEDLSVRAGHDIAHLVADAIVAELPHIQDVEVHVNPVERTGGGVRGTPLGRTT